MTGNEPGIWSQLQRPRGSTVVVIVAAMLAGALVVPAAYGVGAGVGGADGTVAVVEVPQLISASTTGPVLDDLREARQNESIDAVVLDVNTPGGGVGATEELFLEVERTAEEMPVVAHATEMAASGGYYVSAPADRIIANPSAQVGSVGIRMSTVAAGGPTNQITSGPDKAGGFTQEEAVERAEFMVQGFYGAVLEHRGDDLELTETELAHAKVYNSQEAVHNGMIDEIGTTETAIQAAADEAGLDSYEVVRFQTTQPAPVLALEGDGESGSYSAAEIIDPAPGVETTVPLALHGTLPDERPVVTTAGDGIRPVATGEVTGDA